MKITRRVTIEAEPEFVWDVITNLRRTKEWTQGFEDYPHISEDWPAEGSDAVWRYHAGPISMDFKLRMKESLRGRMIYIENEGAFGKGTEFYRFSFDSGLTTVDYETSNEPSLLGWIMMPLMIRKLIWQIDTTIANLKKYCEQGREVR
jgi:carbon monoxide dehydrogenase subunit G